MDHGLTDNSTHVGPVRRLCMWHYKPTGAPQPAPVLDAAAAFQESSRALRVAFVGMIPVTATFLALTVLGASGSFSA